MNDLNADGGIRRASLVRRVAGWVALALTTCGIACGSSEPVGKDANTSAGTAGSSVDAAGAAGQRAGAANDPDWCAARRVLEAKCQVCHTDPPQHGAPFPLLSYEDTQTVNGSGKARYQAIAAMVADDFMPPSYIELEPPVQPLSADEKATLLGWCEAGATHVADDVCSER